MFYTAKSKTVSLLIKKLLFTISNLMFKQDIGIPVGIDPAPFWANLFLYLIQSKYGKKLISLGSPRVYKYHGTWRFINEPLCHLWWK